MKCLSKAAQGLTIGLALTSLAGASTQPPTSAYTKNNIAYEVYYNERFGFATIYPADILSPADELPSGEGRVFVSGDGSAALHVYGTALRGDHTLGEMYAKELQDPLKTVTYNVLKDNWFVVSGYEDGIVFYRKTIDIGSALINFRIDYHPGWKPLMDEITTEISHAFKAPLGSGNR